MDEQNQDESKKENEAPEPGRAPDDDEPEGNAVPPDEPSEQPSLEAGGDAPEDSESESEQDTESESEEDSDSESEEEGPESASDAPDGEASGTEPAVAAQPPLAQADLSDWRSLLAPRLKQGSRIVLGRTHVISWSLLQAIASIAREKGLSGVALWGGILRSESRQAAMECAKAGIEIRPCFLNGVTRASSAAEPWLARVLRRGPSGIRPLWVRQDQLWRWILRGAESHPTVVVARVTEEREGRASFGIDCDHIKDLALLSRSREDVDLVVTRVPGMPWTNGLEECPNLIDRMEDRPAEGWTPETLGILPEWGPTPLGSADHPLVDRAMELILQHRSQPLSLDAGSVGSAIAERLASSEWTGSQVGTLLHPGIRSLFDAGKLEGSHVSRGGERCPLPGVMTATCAVGDRAFYEWMNDNDHVAMLPDSLAVTPEAFAGCVAVEELPGLDLDLRILGEGVDWMGARDPGSTQVVLEGIASRDDGLFIGCLRDVVVDGWGRALSCLASSSPWDAQARASLADLTPLALGKIFVVSNHGTAALSGLGPEECIKALISIAAPDVRRILGRIVWKRYRIA